MKKTILISSAILFIAFVFTGLSQQIVHAGEIAGKTVRIAIDQSGGGSPVLLSAILENNNPERYMVSLPNNFYVVKEVDAAGNVLYEGQVKRTKLDPVTLNDGSTTYVEVPEKDLVINFPYFTEARKINIYSETGALILEVDFTKYAVGSTPTPAPRFGDCNKCGYCAGKDSPGNMESCMACLYPDYVDNPGATLLVDPLTNQSIQPRIGAYYTQLGCIDVGIGGFRDESAAGGVTDVILTRFLFPITGVLSFVALVYGSFLMMTAKGNTQQIKLGRKWIYGAIIGVTFSFMSIFLIRIIAGRVLKIPGFDS